MIFTLTDRQYNVLDVLTTDDYLIGQYTDSFLETLDINIPVNSLSPDLWTEGNYVMCADKAGRKYWFTIVTFKDNLNSNDKTLACYSGTIDVMLEDAATISGKEQPFVWYFNSIFTDTGITIGTNELDGQKRTLEYTSTDKTNAEMLQFVLNGFDNAEARFEVEFKGSTPVSLKLNIYKHIGLTEPQTLLSDDDDSLTELERSSSIEELGTCLRLSGADVDGKNISLSGKYYEEKDSAGNILYYSPKADFRIYSVKAREKYYVDLPGKTDSEFTGYINRTYDSEAKTQDTLWTAGLAQLKKIDHAVLEYEAKGKINCSLGDDIIITASTMRPKIMISARVVEFKFNDDDDSRNEYLFTNYVNLETKLDDNFSKIIADLKARLGDIEAKTKTFATTDQVAQVQTDVDTAKTDLEKVKTDVSTVKTDFEELEKVAVVQDTVDKMQQAISADLATQAQNAQANLDAAKAELQKLADDANLAVQAKYDEYVAETAETAKAIADAKAQADSALSTADGTKLTVDEQAKKIESVVATSEANTKAVTKAQQTADGLTATVATAQETADGAVTKATTAQQTADGLNVAITKAQEAADGLATDITTISAKVGKVEIAVADAATKAELKVESDKITIGVKDAKDYADGAVSKVEVHTAWAWSADGTDRFTTSYPRENVFLDSAKEVTRVTPGRREFLNSPNWDASPLIDEYGKDTDYTISFDIKSEIAGSMRVYAQNGSGAKYQVNAGKIVFQTTTEYQRFSFTTKFYKTIDNDTMSRLAFFGTHGTGVIPTVKNVKFSLADDSFIYTPSPLEDPVNAYPHYVGTSLKDSDNPADYTWQMDPAYLSIMSEMALQGKLDNDSFYEAMDGKVNVEDFLENQQAMDTLKDTLQSFMAETFTGAIDSLNARSDGVLVELGRRLASFEFLTTYIKMGEEGLIIGAGNSPMQALFAKDKMAFVDGGKTIAYFTNQSFYINRGAILTSLQVGPHIWARTDSINTVVQYVGDAISADGEEG